VPSDKKKSRTLRTEKEGGDIGNEGDVISRETIMLLGEMEVEGMGCRYKENVEKRGDGGSFFDLLVEEQRRKKETLG